LPFETRLEVDHSLIRPFSGIIFVYIPPSWRAAQSHLAISRGIWRCSKVVCGKCGRYTVSKLVAKYEPELALPDLRGILAVDRPRMKSISIYELCGINFPRLPASM
jgi:RNase P/RNase MRP subunit POP5